MRTLNIIFLINGLNKTSVFSHKVTVDSLVEFVSMYLYSSSSTLLVDLFNDLNIVLSSGVQKANDRMNMDMCLLCRCPSCKGVCCTSPY